MPVNDTLIARVSFGRATRPEEDRKPVDNSPEHRKVMGSSKSNLKENRMSRNEGGPDPRFGDGRERE